MSNMPSSSSYAAGPSSSASGSSVQPRSSTSSSTRPSRTTPGIDTNVNLLLVSTKGLLEGLVLWAAGRCSEDHISTIYVTLGNDFNKACAAFAKEEIHMTELLSVPADLRICLEACLGEAPCQATLERHLPRVRAIIIDLLAGLKRKQALSREKVAASKARRAAQVAAGAVPSGGTDGSLRRGSHASTQSTRSREEPRRFASSSATSPSTQSAPTTRSSTPNAPPATPPPGFSSNSRYEPTSAPSTLARVPPYTSDGLPSGPRVRSDRSASNGGVPTAGPPPLPTKLPSSQSSSSLSEAIGGDMLSPARSVASSVGSPTRFGAGERTRAFSPPPPARVVDAPIPVPTTPTNAYTFLPPTTFSPPISVRPPSSTGTYTPLPSLQLSEDTFSPSFGASQSAIQLELLENAEHLESLESVKASDYLTRRASKRFSAYAMQKISSPGRSPSSDSLAGTMATSETRGGGSAGKELSQASGGSAEDKRGTSVRRMKDNRLHRPPIPPMPVGASPGRNVETIEEEESPSPVMSGTPRISSPTDDEPFEVVSPSNFNSPLLSPESQASPTRNRSRRPSVPRTVVPEVEPEFPISVYLQIGNEVEKARLDQAPTIATLRLLFVERFQYNPGHSDFPAIYLRDPVVQVQYRLEDMDEVKNGSVLSLNIDTVGQVKQHIDAAMSTLSQEIKAEVRSSMAAMRRASAIHSPEILSPVISRVAPSERQFHDVAQKVLGMKRIATMSPPMEDVPTLSSLARVSSTAVRTPLPESPVLGSGNDANMVAVLKTQHEQVQNLRREVGVLRQVYGEFTGTTKDMFAALRARTARVQALAATQGSSGRAFLEAGKARLESESTALVLEVDVVQDNLEAIAADIRAGKPPPPMERIAEIEKTLNVAYKSRDELHAWMNAATSSWKNTRSEELQTIVNEEELLKNQVTIIEDLRIDLGDCRTMLELIQATARKGAPKKTRGFVPLPVEDEAGSRQNMMSEVRGLNPDVNKRLEAIAKAEKERQAQRSAKKGDEFSNELGGFIAAGKLKKSGGIEETERLRQVKSAATLKSMFSG